MQITDVLELITKGGKISIDSRTIEKNDVFFAINNGVDFVESAFSKGAIAAIVPNNYDKNTNENLVFVPNVLQVLLEIGEKIKLESQAKIIGITGSAGKTTTKVWLSEVLSKNHKVIAGVKNYNTIYGLPICLSMLKHTDDFGVFELGSNNSGEIKELSQYLQPNVGVITNIMDSHIGRFGSKQAIADEKISIIDGIKPDGIIVFDGNSEFSNQIVDKSKERGIGVVSYGFRRNNDFVVEDYIKYFGEVRSHFDLIKTCVLATIYALGLDINNYFDYMNDLKPIDGRGALNYFNYLGKKFALIDDSYNASPSTVIASLNFLKNAKGYNKKIAVIGEMKELGDFSLQYHTQVAKYLERLNFDKVIFVGSQEVTSIFSEKAITVFEEINDEVIEKILENIDNNDLVLLKGSNSIHLDKIVKFLKQTVICR